MVKRKGPSLWEVFGSIPDPREMSGKRFSLQSILSLVFCGLACGRTSLAAIFRWGRSLGAKQLLRIGISRHKSPCQSTIHLALKALDPESMVPILGAFVRSYAGRKADLHFRHLALDGKTLRGSKNVEYPGIHVLSAFLTNIDGVIDQMEVPFKKGNEATQALKLLDRLPVAGKLITGDAAFTQKSVCQKIRTRGGDYLLAVKSNQPGLQDQIALVFGPPIFPLGGSKKRTRDNKV